MLWYNYACGLHFIPLFLTLPCIPAAQQEAQRAQFFVEKAKQERQQKVVQAEGEAEAAKMISSLFLKGFSFFSYFLSPSLAHSSP